MPQEGDVRSAAKHALSAPASEEDDVLRRAIVIVVAAFAALSLSAPAFANGLGGIVDQVLNSCQNIKDGTGSCP
jgi:hypothetical protein